jgi:phage-related protein
VAQVARQGGADTHRHGHQNRRIRLANWNAGLSAHGNGTLQDKDRLGGNRTARVLFCISEGQMILLHGFIKKSQKTAKPDLNLAIERKRFVERER